MTVDPDGGAETSPTGAGPLEADEIESPDDLHRRVAGPGRDGKTIEVLAARRGVTMRPGGGYAGGAGASDLNPVGIVVGFIIDLVLSIFIDAALDTAAEGRPWKIKAYRRHGPFVRRLHSEVLPHGEEPEERMLDVFHQFAGPTHT